MLAQILQRNQVSEIFFGGRRSSSLRPIPVKHPSELPSLEPLSVAAIWADGREDRFDLPEIIITADGKERDWLAWFITFAPTVRPFTAHCRIIGQSSFINSFDSYRLPNLGRLENACLGLILGEVLSSEGGNARLKEPLTASACASVLSFALVRQIALKNHADVDNDNLAELWAFVRNITQQRERKLPLEEITDIAKIIKLLLNKSTNILSNNNIVRACQELIDSNQIVACAGSFGQTIKEAMLSMDGTREERVDVFERVLRESLIAEPSKERSFVLGYLASRINPGTLVHAQLLIPALGRYPSALLWYGVCAGLNMETSILGEFGGIGRRVVRDLLVPDNLMMRPRADLGVMELEILLAGERMDDFPVGSPSQLTVELLPGVSTVLNWSSRARSRKTPDELPRSEESVQLEQELSRTIGRLTDLYRRIRGQRGDDITYEQGSLFETRPPRRGRPR